MYEFVLDTEHGCIAYIVHQGRTEMRGMLLCTYVVQGAQCGDNSLSQRRTEMFRKGYTVLKMPLSTNQ